MDLSGRSTRGKDRKRSNGNEQHYLSLFGQTITAGATKNVMRSNFECLVQLDEYTSSKNVLKIKATFIQS